MESSHLNYGNMEIRSELKIELSASIRRKRWKSSLARELRFHDINVNKMLWKGVRDSDLHHLIS